MFSGELPTRFERVFPGYKSGVITTILRKQNKSKPYKISVVTCIWDPLALNFFTKIKLTKPH